jgi:hypothetical protein
VPELQSSSGRTSYYTPDYHSLFEIWVVTENRVRRRRLEFLENTRDKQASTK